MPSRSSIPFLISLSTIINPITASPITIPKNLPLESRTFLFRVTAYNNIINHILKNNTKETRTNGNETQPVLESMAISTPRSPVRATAIVGLMVALVAVLAIASLVTAATLSVLAFNKIYLRVIADCGNEKEKLYARKVLRIRRKPYSMICAFVFTGSAMAELIPLLISLIISESSQGTVSGKLDAISIIIAVVLMIVFVELLPLGYTVRKNLFVSQFLIRNHQIEGKPSRFANTEERFFSNPELTRFVELHVQSSDASTTDTDFEGGHVHKSVVEIMRGGFKFQDANVKDVIMPLKEMKCQAAMFSLEKMVNREDGLSLYASGLDGGVIYEIEDHYDPQLVKDPGMAPMDGMKIRGFVHWMVSSSHLSPLQIGSN
ncbi:hypothetical protein AA313_de0206138 [Arthrobotrys entomopaga]|nr:hypothetical protein AA313_de0206138 [Arthrobotrys entomopaga]